MRFSEKFRLLIILFIVVPLELVAQQNKQTEATVPIIIDHNRMLVDVELQRSDGTWRKARLWVDSGSPGFFISESLAHDLGIEFSVTNENPNPSIQPPTGVKIGGMILDFEGISSKVSTQPFWLFSAAHNDGNLPATLLKKYHIIFDYPRQQFTIAEPGTVKPRGIVSPVSINQATGIIQMDAVIDGEKFSFALDNGASFSFASEELINRLSKKHSNWPRIIGAIGCANMWGWWPRNEQAMMILRVPEIKWGEAKFNDAAIVAVPKFSQQGPSLGEWYSQKTEHPVDGFLGPNVFKAFRIEINYANSLIYFEKGAAIDANDMDIVGLTLQPQPDGGYKVIGITSKEGKPIIEGIEPGDLLIQVDNLKTIGVTMGKVIDALRGKPGKKRNLIIERNGRQFKIKANIVHQL